jgi:hypothetical protein
VAGAEGLESLPAVKALSLTQPWATLAAIGAKRIETRSWRTSYRGSLLIHAAKGFGREARAKCLEEPFRSALSQVLSAPDAWDELPRGKILAVCELRDCVLIKGPRDVPSPEREFGDYSPGRYAWHLSDVRKLETSVEARGMLGLWTWSGRVLLENPDR